MPSLFGRAYIFAVSFGNNLYLYKISNEHILISEGRRREMKDRTLSILKSFVPSSNPIASTVIEERFQISARTLRNELREINQVLVEADFPEIKTIRKKGYALELSYKERIALSDWTNRFSPQDYLERNSRIFDLILSFSLDNKVTLLYKKEEEYQISKSTMDEDMRRIRHELDHFGIEVLSLAKQGIILRGAERTIRTMIYEVINKYAGVIGFSGNAEKSTNRKILNNHLPDNMIQILGQIYDETMSSREELYRNQLLVFTAVWVCRMQRQDFISGSSWQSDGHTNESQNFIDRVCRFYQLTPTETEGNYIQFMLDTFNSRDMQNSLDWMKAQLLSIQLIQFVEEETKIPFSKKEEILQEGLFKHVAGLINRVKSNIQIVNPLKNNIKTNYANIYRAIEKFSINIEQFSGRLSEDEIAFLTIHFSTSVSTINQDTHYYYRAIVVCNHGLATGKLLAENLKELFDIEVLAVLSSRETDLIDKLDVDLVFSTVELDYPNKPVLILEPIIKDASKQSIFDFLKKHQRYQRLMNKEDSTQLFYSLVSIIERSEGRVTEGIYKEIETLFDKNSLVINKKEIQPMLDSVLKDSNILLQQKVANWEESIQRVSEPLLKESVIEERYVEAMIDSVKKYGAYIVIGKHLALAHARPEDGVNKLGISVATLAEPIVFGNEDNDPVKIIFCLAAVDSYSHLTIMRKLIELVNDEEKIEQLCVETEMTKFKEILFN